MSLFNGMLLFDIPEDDINGWKENIGTRGMYGLWERGEERIIIQPDEDHDFDYDNDLPELYPWKVIHETDIIWEDIAYGTYDECISYAKYYMEDLT